MEKAATKHNFLFFHMGPGLHARADALEFQKKYPHVHFLDQPLDVDYSGLVDWAEEQVLRHALLSLHPLTLLGHSFGGSVIRGVLPKVADKVREIRLLNSVFDPFDCFVNLYNVLNQTKLVPSDYKTRPVAEKMQFIFELAQNPNMKDVYWINHEAQEHYHALMQELPALNVQAFTKIFSEFLTRAPHLMTPWSGPVKIIYSESDSLIRHKEIMFPWRQIYPQAQFIELPHLGHYGHFESQAAAKIFFTDKDIPLY